jgi:hypothetical protein
MVHPFIGSQENAFSQPPLENASLFGACSRRHPSSPELPPRE